MSQVGKLEIKPHLLTLRQVAIMISCHIRTVRRYVEEGKLIGHNPNSDKKGLRITSASVEEYLQKYTLNKLNDLNLQEKTLKDNKKTVFSLKRKGFVKNF